MKALTGRYRLPLLLQAAGLSRSTYFYNISHPAHLTRPDLEPLVKRIWDRSPNGCGHRQIWMTLHHEFGKKVSAKSVLKVMRRLGLACQIRRRNPWKKYSSFRGMFGGPVPNLLHRDFHASHPFEKLGTDAASSKWLAGKPTSP